MEEFTHADEVREVADGLASVQGGVLSRDAIRTLVGSLKSATPSSHPQHLAAIDTHTQALLPFALGLQCEGASAAGASSSAQQAQQSTKNNQLLASEGALPLYTALLGGLLLEHRTRVQRMYATTAAAAATGDAAAADASPRAPRNPRDLFAKSSKYWLTLKLLRRTLTLLRCLISTHRTDATFMHALLHDAYLLNLLFETLSVAPTPEPADSPDDEAESDEFIVEYSEQKVPLSRKKPASKVAPPQLAGVDPSTEITSAFWKAQARASFTASVSMEHISSVSFVPLAKILPLIELIVDAAREVCAQGAQPLPLAPSTAPHLFPFQLQEICAILSTVHGPITFLPELVDSHPTEAAVAAPVPPSPLLQFATEPPTASFPFVATQPLPPAVRTQLANLAAYLVPSTSRPFQSPLLAPATKGTNPEQVYGLLLPHLKRHVTSLSQILLVATPGFDIDQAAKQEPSLGDDEPASEEPAPSYIDLRQQLLSPTALASSDADAAVPFFLRQTKEIILDSTCRILLGLRAIISGLPDPDRSGECLALRYFQQLVSDASLPILLAKCLSQDVEKSIMRTTEGVAGASLALMRGREAWAKVSPSASAPLTVQSGLSPRLLRAFASAATLLHISLDAPSSQSTLLYCMPLYRAGTTQVLSGLFAQSLSAPSGPAAIKSPQDVAQWALLRERVALAFRAFHPFLDSANVADKAVRTFLSAHPSAAFFTPMAQFLFSSPLSPLREVAAQLKTGVSAHLTSSTAELAHELRLAARRRFPYGEAAPTSGPTTTGSGGGGNTMGGNALPTSSPANVSVDPPSPGLGQAFLYQPAPVFPTILRNQFVRARLDLPLATPVADALERNRTISRQYTARHDAQRLIDEKNAKLDRILSLPTRTGAHASALRAYDLYPTSVGPPIVNRTEVSAYQYLLLGDATRRWATESWHLRAFQTEIPLEQPSLAHRPLPTRKARLRRARQERKDTVEQRLEKYIASAAATSRRSQVASTVGTAPGSGSSALPGASCFAHPFLATSLSPPLVDLLLRPSVPGASFIKPAAPAAKEATILTGRVELSTQELQLAYAELIASGQFD